MTIKRRKRRGPFVGPWELTTREAEAMDAVAVEGLTNRDAARKLGLQVRTLENVLYRAYYRMDAKPGMEGRRQALALWQEWRGCRIAPTLLSDPIDEAVNGR